MLSIGEQRFIAVARSCGIVPVESAVRDAVGGRMFSFSYMEHKDIEPFEFLVKVCGCCSDVKRFKDKNPERDNLIILLIPREREDIQIKRYFSKCLEEKVAHLRASVQKETKKDLVHMQSRKSRSVLLHPKRQNSTKGRGYISSCRGEHTLSEWTRNITRS